MVVDLLAAIDHGSSRAEVTAERTLLAALGGSCHSPIAVLCDETGAALSLRVALFSPDGAERVDGAASFPVADETGPQRLAADLLARATPGIAAYFSGPQ
jgi:hydroxymethylbilane synthase